MKTLVALTVSLVVLNLAAEEKHIVQEYTLKDGRVLQAMRSIKMTADDVTTYKVTLADGERVTFTGADLVGTAEAAIPISSLPPSLRAEKETPAKPYVIYSSPMATSPFAAARENETPPPNSSTQPNYQPSGYQSSASTYVPTDDPGPNLGFQPDEIRSRKVRSYSGYSTWVSYPRYGYSVSAPGLNPYTYSYAPRTYSYSGYSYPTYRSSWPSTTYIRQSNCHSGSSMYSGSYSRSSGYSFGRSSSGLSGGQSFGIRISRR